MKKYDIVFSLGMACRCSQCLRSLNLQFASYPFDWVGGGKLLTRARTIAGGFEGWFEREDLELVYIRRSVHYNWVMRNRKTLMVYAHDFPLDQSVNAAYPAVAEKYRRRVERFMRAVSSAKRVLAVCAELPNRTGASDEEIREAHRLLAEKFPGTEIDLLCFRQDDASSRMVVRELDNHTTSVTLDYRKYENGKVSYVFDSQKVCEYLRANVEVDDPRSEEERRKYDEDRARIRAERWGTGRIERFVNSRLYRIYRTLDAVLVKRGVIPADTLAQIGD